MSAPATKRTELLDALRGFALFGVVFSNFAMFSFWLFMAPEEQAALPGAALDPFIGFFHSVFIDGKFYSIFSLLFGIGFGFFLDKGKDGLARFVRRLVILLGIGWLHLRYLWEGDILLLYALLGLLLLLFRRAGDRTLLVVAVLLLLSPLAVDAVKVLSHGELDPSAQVRAMAEAADLELGVPQDAINTMVPNGGLQDFNAYQGSAWLWRIEYVIASNRLPKVLAMFLVGLWVYRRKIFADPAAHRELLRRVFVLGFTIGLPFSLWEWWCNGHAKPLPDAEGLMGTLAYAFGVVPLAMAYASGFALLWTQERWRQRSLVLAPMGRMALTNYLMQTIVALAMFSGMGLGWGTRVSAISFEGIAVLLFIVQVWWSAWWLARFQFGPMEWLWRSLTYGKVMPIWK